MKKAHLLELLNVLPAQVANGSIPPIIIVILVILLVQPVNLLVTVLLHLVHNVNLPLQSTKVMVLVLSVLVLVVLLMVVDLI